jgi:sugar phosphate isomerase/epimerase
MNEFTLKLGVGFTLPGDTSPFERTAEWIREQGFAGVMIGLDPAWSDEETQRVGKSFADRGISVYEIAAYTSLVHEDAGTRRANINGVKRRIEQASIVGALCVATVGGSAAGWAPHPKTQSKESWNLLLEATHEILGMTPENVTFCLEPWPPTVLPDLDSLSRVIEEVGSERLGILFDPANLVTPKTYFTTGAMINEAFDRLSDRFIAVHCKDIYWLMEGMQTGLGETVPGRGVLDYETFLGRVASAGRELPLIIEHLKDPEEVLEAASFIRQRAREMNVRIN